MNALQRKLPFVINLILALMMLALLTYWIMQLMQPSTRLMTAPKVQASFEPSAGQWGAMFGKAQTAKAESSDYQLKGVMASHNAIGSSAIFSVSGKPEQIVSLGQSIVPNVLLVEVQQTYVVVREAGIDKRLELPKPEYPH